jgi:recombination protein RecR
MSHYPNSIRAAIQQIAKLPGIGEKTAERLVLHLLYTPRKDVQALTESILAVKDKVRTCSRCFSLSDDELCRLCADPARNARLLCVVEQPADLVALEKSGAYRGLYFILGGVLSPINGVGPDDIRIRELLRAVKREEVSEVVLATSTNVEGEATAAYIGQLLSEFNIKVTRIASGVPMGGELKYVDQVTLKRAMETRHGL